MAEPAPLKSMETLSLAAVGLDLVLKAQNQLGATGAKHPFDVTHSLVLSFLVLVPRTRPGSIWTCRRSSQHRLHQRSAGPRSGALTPFAQVAAVRARVLLQHVLQHADRALFSAVRATLPCSPALLVLYYRCLTGAQPERHSLPSAPSEAAGAGYSELFVPLL